MHKRQRKVTLLTAWYHFLPLARWLAGWWDIYLSAAKPLFNIVKALVHIMITFYTARPGARCTIETYQNTVAFPSFIESAFSPKKHI